MQASAQTAEPGELVQPEALHDLMRQLSQAEQTAAEAAQDAAALRSAVGEARADVDSLRFVDCRFSNQGLAGLRCTVSEATADDECLLRAVCHVWGLTILPLGEWGVLALSSAAELLQYPRTCPHAPRAHSVARLI